MTIKLLHFKLKTVIYISMFLLTCQSIWAQNVISGIVTDKEDGSPILGVNVFLSGTSVGTQTDFDGKFTISSDQDFPWTLKLSYVGYNPKTVTVSSPTSSLSIVMEKGVLLQDVVVYAQKRAQNPKDVPVAMTVVSGDVALANGQDVLTELSLQIPNVTINNGFTGPDLNVRGISSGGNRGFEQSVGQFIDGFYLGQSHMAFNAFLDVQQTEILKGSQPLFFGQSTIGGALSILTNSADRDDWNGYVNVAGGSQEEYALEGAIGGAITDGLRIRAAARYKNWDGYLEDTNTGELIGGLKEYGGRLTLALDLSEKSVFKFKVESGRRFGDGSGIKRWRSTTGFTGAGLRGGQALEASMGANWVQSYDTDPYAAFGGTYAPDPNYGEYNGDAEEFNTNQVGNAPLPDGALFNLGAVDANGIPTGQPFLIPAADFSANSYFDGQESDIRTTLLLGTFDIDLGNDYNLTSITGYGELVRRWWADVDMSKYALFHVRQETDYAQFSQELRIASPATDRFNWQLGAYYQKTDHTGEAAPFISNIVGSTGARLTEDAKWLSAFFSFSYNLTDKLYLEGGARYSDISKVGDINSIYAVDGSGNNISQAELVAGIRPAGTGINAGGNNLYDVEVEDNTVNPEFSLIWKGDEQTFYARYANGYKAGGLNAGNSVDVNVPTFGPETADNFELGTKGYLLDNALRYNVAAFYTSYKDLQVSAFDNLTTSFVVTNAGEASNYGVELDFQWQATDIFTLGFDAGYLNSQFDQWLTQANRDELADGRANADGTVDRTGYVLPQAPEFTFSVRPQVALPLSESLNFNGGLIFNYRSGYYFGSNYYDGDYQDGFEMIDANIGIGNPSAGWTLSLYGRNLTNSYAIGGGNDSTGIPLRNFRAGAILNYRF